MKPVKVNSSAMLTHRGPYGLEDGTGFEDEDEFRGWEPVWRMKNK